MFSIRSLTRGVFAASAAAMLSFAAGQAQACELSIEPGSDQWLIRYDPFVDENAAGHFDLALVNHGNSACNGAIQVDLRGEQFGLKQVGESEVLAYAIADERTGTDFTPRSGQSTRRPGVGSVHVAPGKRELVRFAFSAGPGDLPARGVYSQTAFISILDRHDMTMAERPVTLAVQVASSAVMGLKGEFQRNQGTATIDLGELVEGPKPLAASLYVMSTGSYQVSVTSANQGRLRLGASGWYLPYYLSLGGNQMNLNQGDRIEVIARGARDDTYPMAVRIGNVTGMRAGSYSDVLTFTIAAI